MRYLPGNELSQRLDETIFNYKSATGRFYDKKHDSILSISRLSKKVLPKTGWKDFILKINKLKVQSLPNYSTINYYSVCSDGDGVTIEVATVNKYRIYNYPCFESNAQIWQAGNISKIMNLIENEFNFKRLRVK